MTTKLSPKSLSSQRILERVPSYQQKQLVHFLGGSGRIKDCSPLWGTWLYSIEMEFGPEPDCGRLGSETTILLTEPEIRGEALNG